MKAKGYFKGCIVLIILFLMQVIQIRADHMVASDITYKSLGGNTYQITLTFYRDCAGIPAPTSASVKVSSASCGYSAYVDLAKSGPPVEVSSICNASIPNTTCNSGTLPGIQQYTYTGTTVLPFQCKDWVFGYGSCCRNVIITNLAKFWAGVYLESKLDNTIAGGNNSSPVFTNIPTPFICVNQPYTYNHGAIDPDGDSLIYSIISSQEAPGSPLSFASGYSISNPFITSPGGFNFDKNTGSFFVVASQPQVCVITMEVKEYRGGKLIGTVVREMQAIVLSCTNNTPYVDKGEMKNEVGGIQIDSNSVEVCPGTPVSFDILALDPNIGDAIIAGTNIATSIPNATLTITGTNPVSASFSWTPTTADIGLNAFTFSVKDDGCPIVGSQTYTFDIRVIKGTTAGANRYFCQNGGPIQLQAVGGTVFNWTALGGGPAVGLSCTNCSDPLASPNVTTTYVVTSNFPTGTGCKNKDTVTVFVVPSFSLSSSPDTNICSYNAGMPISVTAGPDPASKYDYSWSPAATLSNNVISNPIAKPEVATTYTCTVTSQYGCVMTEKVKVDIKGLVKLTMFPYDGFKTCNTVDLGVHLDPLDFVFYEAFDDEIDSTLWTSLEGGTFDDQCGSYHDQSYYFNQDGNRQITTYPIDLSKGSAITFYLKTGNCRNCLCDYPENDDQVEDLVFEYSIDGGTTWVTFRTFDSDEYALSSGSFSLISINLPASANTATTQLRWRQLNHNVGGKDVWIIDEVKIKTGLNPHTYSWTPGFAVNDSTVQYPVGSPVTNTTYHVTVVDQVTGCVLEDSVKIVYDSLVVVNAPKNLYYCLSNASSYAQLSAVPATPGNYTYKWNPTTALSNPLISNPKASPIVNTTYVVTVEDPTGCTGRASVNVVVNQDFNLLPNRDTALCLASPFPFKLNLTPPNDYTYTWSPATGLSSTNVYNPIITPTGNIQYTVVATNKSSGCVLKDTVNITVYPNFNFTVNKDTVLCLPSNGFGLNAVAGPGTGYTYLWAPSSLFADPTNPAQFVNPTSSITYYGYAYKNCWKTDSAVVKVYPAMTVQTIMDTSVCANNNLFLNASVAPAGDYTYTWSPQNGIASPNSLSTMVTGTSTTEYVITATENVFGCSKSDTVNLTVYPDYNLTISPDVVLCPYQTTTQISALASPGTNYTYFWAPANLIPNPGAPVQDVSPSSDTEFYILVHQTNGCWKSDSVSVSMYNGLLGLKASSDTTIYQGDHVQLVATGANSYSWSPIFPGIDANSSVYLTKPDSSLTFMVIGKDECYVDTAYTIVTVIPVEFHLPNLITPNGDGRNDSFQVTNLARYWNLVIYNRWGDIVYSKDQYTNEWSGENCSDGVYYFLLSNTKTGQKIKSWVQVMR